MVCIDFQISKLFNVFSLIDRFFIIFGSCIHVLHIAVKSILISSNNLVLDGEEDYGMYKSRLLFFKGINTEHYNSSYSKILI